MYPLSNCHDFVGVSTFNIHISFIAMLILDIYYQRLLRNSHHIDTSTVCNQVEESHADASVKDVAGRHFTSLFTDLTCSLLAYKLEVSCTINNVC